MTDRRDVSSFRLALVALALGLAASTPGVVSAQPFDESDDCSTFGFEEAADDLGLSFTHSTGATGDKHLRETMGAGVAWLDFDNDGWWDLYWVQSARSAGGDALFRNLAGAGFERLEPTVSRPDLTYGQGVLAADLDGDRDVDLLVTNVGADRLYLNDGAGGFEVVDGVGASDVAAEVESWSSSAAAADGDADGDLDLYVSRYVEYRAGEDIFCGRPETGERRYCDPSLFPGAADRYLRNEGDGRFVDVTQDSGFGAVDGRGLGVLFVDLDGDRAADLYVANDLTLNFLFANRGEGRFEDLSLLSGGAVNRDGRPEAGMGVALGDVDGDQRADLAVTNFDVETNTLYSNRGEHSFVDVSGPSGFGLPSFNRLAFGIVAADLDHDRDLDAYIANGHIFEQPARENVAYRQPDQLLEGDGRGGFDEVECPVLRRRPTVARGLAAGDLDNDGDLDLAIQENGGPARLLRNLADDESWLGARLRTAGANSEAVGARVTLESTATSQSRWITAGDSYQSSSDRRLHFGLGSEAPVALEIVWPDGARRRLVAPPAGHYLVVDR